MCVWLTNLTEYRNNLIKVADIVLEHDAIVMTPEDRIHSFVTIRAARLGHVQLLEFLVPKLTFKGDICDVMKHAYQNAVAHNQLTAASFLIKSASCNLEEASGWQPLRSAAARGNYEMCNMILTEQACRYEQDPEEFVFKCGGLERCEIQPKLVLHVSTVKPIIDRLAYSALLR
jgi:hypothetical protein